MTRTARSSFPRAISKDRSESKSGTDKHMRKDGGGPHGWGRITDEQQLENAAIEDEELEQGIALAKRTSSSPRIPLSYSPLTFLQPRIWVEPLVHPQLRKKNLNPPASSAKMHSKAQVCRLHKFPHDIHSLLL